MNKVEVVLNGPLGKNFGKNWNVYADSVRGAMDIINANEPGFVQWMIANAKSYDRYHILVENHAGDEREVSDSEIGMLSDKIKKITITPIIIGAGPVFRVVVGVVLMVASIWLGPACFSIGFSLAFGGLSEMLSKQPKKGDVSSSDGNEYYFDGPVNTETQGVPVPVPYGRIMIGSQPINARIDVDKI